MRWVYLGAIIFSSVLPLYISEGWVSNVRLNATIGLVAIVSNGIFYIISRQLKGSSAFKLLAAIIVATDIILVTYLIFTRGGIESRSPILYTIPILMSATLLGRRAVYGSAAACIFVYDCIALGDYWNIFQPLNMTSLNLHGQLPYVLSSITFFSFNFILVGVLVDFITRLLAEKERQAVESLNNLDRAQTIAKFGSWNWNTQTNEITWSKVMYDIFNVPDYNVAITPREFFDKIHPADQKMIRMAVRKTIKKSVPLNFDCRIITDDGMVKYIHGDGEVIPGHSKQLMIIGTARDITEEKLLEQAKDEFVALASHQLRTPSTVVKQYLSMLLDGYAGELSPAQEKFIKIANDSNERQITTINDLLNVAQIDSGKMRLHPETFDLVELLNTIVLEEAVRVTDKHQTISLKTRHKSFYCNADRHRLRMALENIIENAHRYSPENKHIEVRLTRTNRCAVIAIKDHGIGIDKNNIPKVFHKFSQIDNPASLADEGTGLGLYWVEKVIRLHGGTITVNSALHRGSTFTISLPQKRRTKPRRVKKELSSSKSSV